MPLKQKLFTNNDEEFFVSFILAHESFKIIFLGTKDYPLAYAENQIEFNKIIHHLEDKFFIKIGHKLPMSGHRIIFEDVTLTDYGIAEVEKDLPKIPLIGLVNQKISTGDLEIDKTINHAKKLFLNILNLLTACVLLVKI